MANSDRIEIEGIVESSAKGLFKVRISDEHIASCTLSGKMRQSAIRVIDGDVVKVELSEYDTNKGRIIYRMK